MSRSLRRGALAATALAFSLASLSACAAGNDAQTLEVKPDNAATTVGDIQIKNATVISQPKRGPGPAAVSATVFNTGKKAQTLDAIRVIGSGTTVKLHAAKGSGPISVPAGGSVVIGGKGNASAVLTDGHEATRDGDAQRISFTFSDTGTVRMRAFVIPSRSYFEGWGPSEVPKPSASATQSGSATPTGSASTDAENGANAADGSSTTSGSPSGTPSGTPTGSASSQTAGH